MKELKVTKTRAAKSITPAKASTSAIKVEDIDVITGKKEMDELSAMDEEPVAKNWVMKFWYWLA